MSAPTPSKPLPRMIDLRKFAQQGLSAHGRIDVSSLTRLTEAAIDNSGSVLVDLQFDVDEERRRVITGTAVGRVRMECQRCLEAVEVTLSADVALAVVYDDDQAKHLPKYLDPLIVDEGASDLYELVEDELLLILPFAPAHEFACAPKTAFGEIDDGDEEEKKESPFAVLKQLKNTPDS